MNKICILCLPRTGSQLCEKLVSSTLPDNAVTLGELFEKWNNKKYTLDGSGKLTITQGQSPVSDDYKIGPSYGVSPDWMYKLQLTRKFTSAVMRIHLFNTPYHVPFHSVIINDLKNSGYRFISLERNYEGQILSNLVQLAHMLDDTKSNVSLINSVVAEPVHIPMIPRIIHAVQLAQQSKLYWKQNLDSMAVEYESVHYESIYEDLSSIFNITFTPSGNKTLRGDPFDWIINADQVKELIHTKFV